MTMSTKLGVLIASGFLAIATVVTVIVLVTSSGSPSTTPVVPQPISRSELMSKYARLAPLDKSATPETMDSLARTACAKLQQGISTDKLITVSTDMFEANATQVVMLLVSYRCPEFLKDFK